MQSLKVLVVDDHAPTRQGFTEFLRGYGFRVFEASNGGEAILSVHEHQPDAVLLDILLPVLNGIETAESLRACPATAGIRILGITACTSHFDRVRMTGVCDDVLAKPCSPHAVAARILSLVEVRA